jgi:hypothetical protein
MADPRNRVHPHRQKLDGSFDTICLLCLATIANVAVEADLAAFERDHACDQDFLADRELLSLRRLGTDTHASSLA